MMTMTKTEMSETLFSVLFWNGWMWKQHKELAEEWISVKNVLRNNEKFADESERTRQLVVHERSLSLFVERFTMFRSRAIPLALARNKEQHPMCWWVIREIFIYFVRWHSIKHLKVV